MSIMSRLDLVADDLRARAIDSLNSGEKTEDVIEAVYEGFRRYIGLNLEMQEWCRNQAKIVLKEAESQCKE